jgi:hypothetical protein
MLSTAFFITFGLKSFEIARLRVRFDYGVRVIANANHSIMRAAVKPCVADCITESAASRKAILGHRRRSVA